MIINAINNSDLFFLMLNKNDNFISKKIMCEYSACAEIDRINFYTLNDSVFMHSGENITLTGNLSNDDIDTLLSFCNFLSIKSIETDILSLPIQKHMKLNLTTFNGQKQSSDLTVVKNENIYQFTKLCCENFDGINFDVLYANIAKKVNKNLADIYYISNDNNILSGVMLTKYASNIAYINFVNTKNNSRGKGLSSTLIKYVIYNNCYDVIYLLCEDKMLDFYMKLSFKKQSEIIRYFL